MSAERRDELAAIAREREKVREAEQAREAEAIAKEKAAYAADQARKEADARAFIEAVIGESLPAVDFQEALCSGVALCKVTNALL